MAAGAGRTYGRPWIFHLQILFACGPMSLALALHGSPYYIGMAVLSALFFIALKQITTGLQKIFVRALVAREREAALAAQFDTALNNMPHGLCMFGADGRLAVMNHRFSEMMRLSEDLVHRGASAPDIVAACIGAGTVSAASGKLIVSEVDSLQAGYITTADPDSANGRALSWTFQPMAGGGTVVLVEDITERRTAEARISHLARYDELTALPNRVWRFRTMRRDCQPCCLSISTSSSRSTIPLAIRAATNCCVPWPTACARCCVPKISWRASEATSSSCSSRISNPMKTPRVLPAASSIGSASAMRSTITWWKSAPASESR
jgi:PAS domain-containing protein